MVSCQNININSNDNLLTIDSFNNLLKLGEPFSEGNLNIYSNNDLITINGFSKLTEVNGLQLWDLINLLDFEGLNKLEIINYQLFITNLQQLTHLNAFENIIGIQTINLSNNNLLTDISAFEKLSSLLIVNITNNPALDECCIIQTFLDSGLIIPSDITINNNNTNCNNLTSIETNCKDTDQDGIVDSLDNCNSTTNPDQVDIDSDGVGDKCDNCPFTSNTGQEDDDNDGIGNVCEPLSGTDGSGGVGINTTNPMAKLQVSGGDVFIENPYRGIILKSINGNCYRIKVDDAGSFSNKIIECPDN